MAQAPDAVEPRLVLRQVLLQEGSAGAAAASLESPA